MIREIKVFRFLLGLIVLALLVPLIANHRPLIIHFAPQDFYSAQYEELKEIRLPEAEEALGRLSGSRRTGDASNRGPVPGGRAPKLQLENFFLQAESLSAWVEDSIADQVLEALSPLRDSLRNPSSVIREPSRKDLTRVVELLRLGPGVLKRKWLFPAFSVLAWSDLLLLALALSAWLFFWPPFESKRSAQSRASGSEVPVAQGLRQAMIRPFVSVLIIAITIGGLTWCKLHGGPAVIQYPPANAQLSPTALWPPVPFSPQPVDLSSKYEPPNGVHWLGTDSLGRDVSSRLIWGGRVSISVALAAVLAQLILGVLLGGMAGLPGKWAPTFFSRLIEGYISIPSMLVALAILAIAGPSFGILVFTVALSGCGIVAKLFRGELLRLQQAEYVLAATNLGLSKSRVFFVHLLPNAITPLIGHLGYGVAAAILMESSLSFLGLGTQIPSPSWGGMLSEARGQIQYWWLAVFPGLCILVIVFLAQKVADTVQLRLAIKPARV